MVYNPLRKTASTRRVTLVLKLHFVSLHAQQHLEYFSFICCAVDKQCSLQTHLGVICEILSGKCEYKDTIMGKEMSLALVQALQLN
jgi:hypothetical protein